MLDPARHSIASFIAFLARLWKEGSTGAISRDDCNAIYRTIAKRFLASADFSKATSEGGIKLEHGNKRQRTSYHGGNANPTT